MALARGDLYFSGRGFGHFDTAWESAFISPHAGTTEKGRNTALQNGATQARLTKSTEIRTHRVTNLCTSLSFLKYTNGL